MADVLDNVEIKMKKIMTIQLKHYSNISLLHIFIASNTKHIISVG